MENFAKLHARAQELAKTIHSSEVALLEVLQSLDASKGFRELTYPSLFAYATRALQLSEACAYQLITVGRKAREVPALQTALREGEITVSKAKSIAASITNENAAEWITRAKTESTRALEQGEKTIRVSAETFELLKRAQELLAQKKSAPVSMDEALKELAGDFARANDPVQKAERILSRRALHVKSSRHRVHQRDKGACQFLLPDGKICGQRHWTHLHHRIHRSQGGSDEPENLVTLCAGHHRMVHTEP